MSRQFTRDFLTEVALGNVTGYTIWNAMGERETMGTTAQGEDIWRGNDLAPAPTSDTTIPTPAAAGEQMTVVSEVAADASPAGAGIRTLRLEYLDASGDEQTEDITMNGTTGVNTVATNIRFVNDMYALTVGANGVASDHVKIYKTGTVGLVYNMIQLGGNKSLVPHRMVPNAKTLILLGWHATEAKSKRVAMRIRSTDMNGVIISGVFCFKDTAYINGTTTGQLETRIEIPALSIIKVSGWPDENLAETSCSWWGVLVDD
ncbi:MAG: hypothetical protein DRI30_07545 [Chloroflexi bacterium]|nr:MAG: hypothetical protein DRI30_07545 [Chloroflexota bacterium]